LKEPRTKKVGVGGRAEKLPNEHSIMSIPALVDTKELPWNFPNALQHLLVTWNS